MSPFERGLPAQAGIKGVKGPGLALKFNTFYYKTIKTKNSSPWKKLELYFNRLFLSLQFMLVSNNGYGLFIFFNFGQKWQEFISQRRQPGTNCSARPDLE